MGRITVIIPTSIIPSHPSPKILEETIRSVQSHLPHASIILTCDGLTEDKEYRGDAYSQYINAAMQIEGVSRTIVFPKHVHQSGMLLEALPLVETSCLLYLEHDWRIGHPVEWERICDLIDSGVANYVKFAPGNRIHPHHEHMMRGRESFKYPVPIIQTVQYSANPHVASTMWYRRVSPLFEGQTDYIENLLHGPCANAPWEEHKLVIYNPVEGDMKRSFHLDGAGTL